jgi:hypothetical protein
MDYPGARDEDHDERHVSRNSIDTLATLVAPVSPVKNIVYQGGIEHRLVTGG